VVLNSLFPKNAARLRATSDSEGWQLEHPPLPLRIKQQAAYVQDAIKAGNVTLNPGLRLNHYERTDDCVNASTEDALSPRLSL
jgi:outer membrane receptor for Fe3+-dicitrate